MEANAHLRQKAFKEGFLSKLASAGLERRDIPFLLAGFAKQASIWEVPGEIIEGGARIVGPALDALVTQIPLTVAGMGALGGGTLALATSQEQARRQKVLDEEARIRRLIAQTEAANMARGIPRPASMPQLGGA